MFKDLSFQKFYIWKQTRLSINVTENSEDGSCCDMPWHSFPLSSPSDCILLKNTKGREKGFKHTIFVTSLLFKYNTEPGAHTLDWTFSSVPGWTLNHTKLWVSSYQVQPGRAWAVPGLPNSTFSAIVSGVVTGTLNTTQDFLPLTRTGK